MPQVHFFKSKLFSTINLSIILNIPISFALSVIHLQNTISSTMLQWSWTFKSSGRVARHLPSVELRKLVIPKEQTNSNLIKCWPGVNLWRWMYVDVAKWCCNCELELIYDPPYHRSVNHQTNAVELSRTTTIRPHQKRNVSVAKMVSLMKRHQHFWTCAGNSATRGY